jgi:prepilin-type N-terminal cleavage/methylation domain-containing protein
VPWKVNEGDGAVSGSSGRFVNERGSTLIEMLVVVMIIGRLVAIAIPTSLGTRASAQDRVAQSSARLAVVVAKSAFRRTMRTTPMRSMMATGTVFSTFRAASLR